MSLAVPPRRALLALVLLLAAPVSMVRAAEPLPAEPPVLLTPPPPAAPRINAPTVYGCRAAHPFLYRIPCTGQRPIRFAAEGLPAGLQLDGETGILSGRAPADDGEYPLALSATSAAGSDQHRLTIVVGPTLALTPPMGWNSWYIHYDRVTDRAMRQAAEAMLDSGMADFGYQYVNIDDCWMKKQGDTPYRNDHGVLLPNASFPDMQQLADDIHRRGLKAGLYISPGPWTCQRYVGSYEHEAIDARTFAAWGFDFLKYDWCSYGSVATGEGQQRLMKPYRQMGELLQSLDRDIVYNLCQYGMGEVWSWGGQVGGNCWRTTGDLGLARGSDLPGFYQIGLANAEHSEFAQPGQWNDPDYILIGYVGDAHTQGLGRRTSLTPDEQYAYMSMWCLMAAPLIFSGDMTQLDAFTLNVLCNAEVIAIDQDALGRQARIVRRNDDELILAKPLQDGSLAVGLFNLSAAERAVSVSLADLQRRGAQRVRDLWRQEELERVQDVLLRQVPRHGVFLLRLRVAD